MLSYAINAFKHSRCKQSAKSISYSVETSFGSSTFFIVRQYADSAILFYDFCPSVHHIVALYLNEHTYCYKV